MAITDIFSTSLLISLAISLLLVGSVFMYFSQKIAEQNHKIASMFDLVSTMAEEVNSVKYHVQMVAGRVGIPLGMQPPQPPQQPPQHQTHQLFMNGGSSQCNTNSNLITISEDEEEDEDSEEEDDETDDEDDDEDDDDDDDEDSDDNDDSEDDEDNERSQDNDRQDIKINEEDSDDLDIENLENLNFESVADLQAGEVSESLTNSDIKKINISPNDNDNEEELDSEDLSEMNIKNVEVLDYKKLSLNKLRSIVTEKGIVTDASKLKKHELLKLLEVE